MSGRYLLDTSILVSLFADDEAVKERLAQADEVFIPSIAVGELYYGALKSRRIEENLGLVENLIAESVVLGCGVHSARHYGELKNALRIRGRPIPENDLWIAAIGLEYGLTIATRDRHFLEIVGLKLEVW